MPGPIVHLIVQQRLESALHETSNVDVSKFLELIKEDPCSPYTGFGSMGPDFLFFSLKEYGTPLDEFVNAYFEVMDALDPLIKFYQSVVEPVEDAIDDAIAAADQAAFDGLLGQIQNTTDLITSTALTAAASVLTSNVDLFFPFHPKIQNGEPETDWYWIDFLHIRRTGQFGSELWRLASNSGDRDLMRYCLGYTSHIGSDVAGHPFVNTVVGGPYRTHWHRHKLVENWIDAYARNYYRDDQTVKSCLKLGDDDHYDASNISGSYYSRLCEFPNQRMPEKLSEMFALAMQNTFNGTVHPVLLTAADIDTSYRLWLRWFERTTSIGSAVKPTPVPPPGSATVSLITDYFSGIPTPPGGGGLPGGGGFSIAGIFAAIAAFAKWLVDTLLYTLQWIIMHSVDILALPYTEAIAFMKWLLYQVQKYVWEIYDNLRFGLVLGGYLFPESRDLDKTPWGSAFINSAYVHTTGGVSANFDIYPRKEEFHNLGGPVDHHLVYQGTPLEVPHAEPMPKPFHNQWPETFIDGWHPYDPFMENLYSCTRPYGNDVNATHHVDGLTWFTPQMGSALQLSSRLIANNIDDLPNFNLDGDRGYGWKTWRQTGVDPEEGDPDKQLDNANFDNLVDVTYIDS